MAQAPSYWRISIVDDNPQTGAIARDPTAGLTVPHSPAGQPDTFHMSQRHGKQNPQGQQVGVLLTPTSLSKPHNHNTIRGYREALTMYALEKLDIASGATEFYSPNPDPQGLEIIELGFAVAVHGLEALDLRPIVLLGIDLVPDLDTLIDDAFTNHQLKLFVRFELPLHIVSLPAFGSGRLWTGQQRLQKFLKSIQGNLKVTIDLGQVVN
jgi:hypothetical protein